MLFEEKNDQQNIDLTPYNFDPLDDEAKSITEDLFPNSESISETPSIDEDLEDGKEEDGEFHHPNMVDIFSIFDGQLIAAPLLNRLQRKRLSLIDEGWCMVNEVIDFEVLNYRTEIIVYTLFYKNNFIRTSRLKFTKN